MPIDLHTVHAVTSQSLVSETADLMKGHLHMSTEKYTGTSRETLEQMLRDIDAHVNAHFPAQWASEKLHGDSITLDDLEQQLDIDECHEKYGAFSAEWHDVRFQCYWTRVVTNPDWSGEGPPAFARYFRRHDLDANLNHYYIAEAQLDNAHYEAVDADLTHECVEWNRRFVAEFPGRRPTHEELARFHAHIQPFFDARDNAQRDCDQQRAAARQAIKSRADQVLSELRREAE